MVVSASLPVTARSPWTECSRAAFLSAADWGIHHVGESASIPLKSSLFALAIDSKKALTTALFSSVPTEAFPSLVVELFRERRSRNPTLEA